MPRTPGWSEHQNQARLEDLEFMVDTGETLTGAAARLGITLSALHKWCTRHDHLHLYHRLAARDPEHHNRKENHAA